MERYGSQKTAEMARNNFPHMTQEKNEASEDFLDRLSREYRRGSAHERSQTVRDQMVLNVFLLGLSEENLATSLQMEYSKPSYVGHPPSVNELRAYVRRLESSRSLRTMKGGDATHSRGPSYTMRNNYGKENYPSLVRHHRIKQCATNSSATCRGTLIRRQCSSGIDRVLETWWTGT